MSLKSFVARVLAAEGAVGNDCYWLRQFLSDACRSKRRVMDMTENAAIAGDLGFVVQVRRRREREKRERKERSPLHEHRTVTHGNFVTRSHETRQDFFS